MRNRHLQEVLSLLGRLVLGLGLGAVEHLEEVVGLGPHALMHVGLGALEVIVQVVAQHADHVYGVLARILGNVARHEHKGDVAAVVAHKRVRVVELGRRMLVAEEHLRRLLKLAPRLEELLHEHLAEYDVVLALERGAEYDGDAVVEGAHKERLVRAVVDDGRLVARLALLLELEVLLEYGGEAVALEQARLHRHLLPVGGHLGQVEEQRDAVVGLRLGRQVVGVLALDELVGAVLLQLAVELEAHAELQLAPVAARIRQVVDDAVEVGNHQLGRLGLLTVVFISKQK